MRQHPQYDLETRIYNLSLEIKYLVEENNLNKNVIIDDFQDLIFSEIKEFDNENPES